ncbi:hypothetical protein N7528_009134 [Penicillium herquei]|nr:hypothetical protein N7528_009134 [Penicillium herquei]
MKKHLKDITSRAKGSLKRFEKEKPKEKSLVNEPPDEHSTEDRNDRNQDAASIVCKDASHDKLPTETTSPQSTWGQAYDALKKDDEQLINEYEALLSQELPTEGTHSDNVDNRISTISSVRQAQLRVITDIGLKRAEASRTKYKIAGHEFVVQEQIAQAANFIIWAKDLITAATSVSTEASLIWAGVSLILPVLTNHTTAEQANRDGFTHVTGRMRFYIALEPRLLSREDNRISQDLRREFEKSVLSLYRTILKFQIQSVLRFYKTSVQKTRGDIFNPDVWQNMLDEITKIETALTEDFRKINDTAVRNELETLNNSVTQSTQEIQNILHVAKKQLEVNQEQLQTITEELIPPCFSEATSRDFLAKLPSQPEAAFDSRENEKLRDCHSGTRQDILNTIADWAVGNGSERSETNSLFWVHGQAGTGKSTISRTMCRLFQESGILGASYFFRRDGGRVKASRLFPTIARQLVDTIPSFASSLRESLLNYDRPEIEAKGAMGQCRTLIMEPLENLSKPDRGDVLTRVIVIDALDECSPHDELESIIQSFSTLRLLDSVRLLVFVTGRVISPLVDAFQILDSKGVKYRSLALQTDFREETEKDISMFLKDTFQAIRTRRNVLEDPWPEPDDMEKLVRLATNPSPLFIYASTLCLFVDDGKSRKSPIKQVKAWLSQRKNASQLDQIYRPVLHQLLLGTYDGADDKANLSPLDDEDREQLIFFLGSICVLSTPLSIPALGLLLDIEEYDIDCWVQNLHAVLNVSQNRQDPVDILHKSFSDFILSHEGIGINDIRIDPRDIHGKLASNCIELMKNKLHQNICHISHVGPVDLNSEDMVSLSKEHIPSELAYACLNWIHHLIKSDHHFIDTKEIESFLEAHLLHWIEVLALLRELASGSSSIRDLRQMMMGKSEFLKSILGDATRFLAAHGSIISQAPLQTYGSALVFSPEQTVIRSHYWKQRLPFIEDVQGIEKSWSSCLHTLVLEDWNEPYCADFSPTGDRIVIGYFGVTEAVWDITTGVCLYSIKANLCWTQVIKFSPSGDQIASAIHDHMEISKPPIIRLLSAKDGAIQRTIDMDVSPSDQVQDIRYSPSGSILACCTNESLWLLNTLTGDKRLLTRFHEQVGSHTIAFSPDESLMAIGTEYDSTLCIWNIKTEAGNTPTCHKVSAKKASAIAFDQNKSLVLLAEGAINHLDLESGSLKEYGFDMNETPEEDLPCGSSSMFSADGETLISVASDFTSFSSWDKFGHRIGHIGGLEGWPDSKTLLCFSQDGNLIASDSPNDSVRVWGLFEENGGAVSSHEAATEVHHENIIQIAISRKLKLAASASSDWTIRLWNLDGSHKRSLIGHDARVSAVAFSSDGCMLASGSLDPTIRVWDPHTGDCLKILSGVGAANHVSFTSDNRKIVSLSDEDIQVFDIETCCLERTIEAITGLNKWLAFSTNSDGIKVFSQSENYLHTWDLTDSELSSLPVSSLRLPSMRRKFDFQQREIDMVISMTPSTDGSLIACGFEKSCQDPIGIWNTSLESMQILDTKGEINSNVSFAFSHDSNFLASASSGVIIWDLATHEMLKVLPHCRSPIAFSPAGKILISAQENSNRRIGVWDTENYSKVFDLDLEAVTGMVFNSDATKLAAASKLGYVHVWELKDTFSFTRTHRMQIRQVADMSTIWDIDSTQVTPLAFSPCSSMLACADQDIFLWDLSSSEPNEGNLKVLLNDSPTNDMLFSSDGKIIISCGHSKISRWDVSTGALVQSLDYDKCLDHSAFQNGVYFKMDQTPIDAASADAVSSRRCPHHDMASATLCQYDEASDWIVRNGEELLWVPPDYQPGGLENIPTASSGDNLITGSESGRMCFYNFVFPET